MHKTAVCIEDVHSLKAITLLRSLNFHGFYFILQLSNKLNLKKRVQSIIFCTEINSSVLKLRAIVFRAPSIDIFCYLAQLNFFKLLKQDGNNQLCVLLCSLIYETEFTGRKSSASKSGRRTTNSKERIFSRKHAANLLKIKKIFKKINR